MTTKDRIVKRYDLDIRKRKIHIPEMSRGKLATLFSELGFKRGVEVGTEQGKFAQRMCINIPGVTLYCVDPWSVYEDGGGYKPHIRQKDYDKYYLETQKRLKDHNCFLVRDYSMNVVKDFKDNSLDFVYIDGNHRLDFVTQDIVNWTEKVKPGGIVAGHDYIKQAGLHANSHVPYAVEAYVQAFFINNYFVLGQKSKLRTKEENKHLDRIRSWFFIKDDKK